MFFPRAFSQQLLWVFRDPDVWGGGAGTTGHACIPWPVCRHLASRWLGSTRRLQRGGGTPEGGGPQDVRRPREAPFPASLGNPTPGFGGWYAVCVQPLQDLGPLRTVGRE